MSGKEISLRAEPMLPGVATTSDANRIAKSFQIEDGRVGHPPLLDRLPTADERRIMHARSVELSSALRKANTAQTDEIKARAAIALMLNGYSSLRNANIPDMVDGYWLSLGEHPLFAILMACEDVTQARLPDMDVNWPPASPRLVKAAKEHAAPVENERHLILQIMSATKTMRPVDKPGAAERVLASLADFKAQMPQMGTLTVEEKAQIRRRDTARSEDEILRQYQALGIEPIRKNGLLLSPALAQKLGALRA